ncbi:MAG: sensor histidine kinase [Alphaproteobacteria bacterium]|nr:sensor histidine kinase [Alphaproteobacteria bacterium]
MNLPDLRLALTWARTGVDPAVLAESGASMADLDSFQHFNYTVGIRAGRWLALALMGFNLLFWPTDAWLLDLPGVQPALWQGRALATLFGVAMVAASYVPPRFVPSVAWTGAVGVCAIVALTLGRIGGPGTAWFHFIYPFLFVGLIAWQFPLQRVWSTVVLACAVLVAYFAPNPQHLHDPMAGSSVAHLGFIVMLSIGIGLFLDRSRLRLFLFGLQQARRSDDLAARVAEQTAEIQALLHHVESAREEERAFIARELHDEMGQVFTGMRLMLKVARTRLETTPGPLAEELGQIAEMLSHGSTTLRELLTRLRPRVLDDLGLGAAAEWLVRRTDQLPGLRCTLHVEGDQRLEALPTEVATVAFRVLQEALTNVVRHAGATEAVVTLRLDPAALVLIVQDDGAGFEPSAARPPGGGMGLPGMRERARAVGGDLTLRSTRGEGTRLRLSLPLREEVRA